ncbi:hypothetical protein HYX14_05430 [Candidatus Woesearchaeota archaeon]|nr:hypothetical protein [Candidatus Woesearchaeota archaeon]
MDIRKTRTCERCKVVVPLPQVRLFPKDISTNILVCENCCEDLKRATKAPALQSKVKNLPQAEYKSFSCSRCDYDFRIDKAKAGITHNIMCPYCGQSDRLRS